MTDAVDRGSAIRTPLDLPLAEHEARAVRHGYFIVELADGRVMAERLGVQTPLAHMALALGDHDRGMIPADLPGPPSAAHAGSAAMSDIAGSGDAQRLLLAVRDGCAPADLLLEAFSQVQATSDAERLRAFARQVQKALEGRG